MKTVETIFAAWNLEKEYRERFHFRKEKALRGFQMKIHRGDIYGFVGPNGAGKTTLMRVLTGRTEKSRGELSLFGAKGERDLAKERKRIGALIERPAFFPNMTAWDNLEILRLQKGIREKESIGEALGLMGLSDDAFQTKKVKYFSLGMKQRLGLAMAVFAKPELLVLDEPINGLDPEGIAAFREIVKMLHKEYGMTILISSHLLGELNQLATCYGFIRKGKMLEEITAEELQERCRSCLTIFVDDAVKAEKILQKNYPACDIKMSSERRIKFYGFSGNTGEVTERLVLGGAGVIEIRAESTSLETYYMSLTKRTGFQ